MVESKRFYQQQKRILQLWRDQVLGKQTVVTKTENINLTLLVHTFHDEVPFNNSEIKKFNSSVHGTNTRHKIKLQKLSTKLTMYQNGVYYSSIRIYNKLLDVIAELVSNKKCFLIQLKKNI